MIGALIYLMATRIDILFAVHKLAKFSANPGKVHFDGLIHLLQYLHDSTYLGFATTQMYEIPRWLA